MNEKYMIRQGDVLLIPIPDDTMPLAPRAVPIVKKSKTGRLVLAVGESSLHEHTLDAADAELVRQGEKILLTILRPQALTVTHAHTGAVMPRHTPIELPGGVYEVRHQRRAEINPAGMPQRWSHVRD